MPLYDYRCRTGHRTEALRSRSEDLITCPKCGLPAFRQAANRIAGIVIAETVNLRNKFSLFREASAELDYHATRQEASTGQTVSTPDLFTTSKQRAQQMDLHGEAPAVRRMD